VRRAGSLIKGCLLLDCVQQAYRSRDASCRSYKIGMAGPDKLLALVGTEKMIPCDRAVGRAIKHWESNKIGSRTLRPGPMTWRNGEDSVENGPKKPTHLFCSIDSF